MCELKMKIMVSIILHGMSIWNWHGCHVSLSAKITAICYCSNNKCNTYV